MRSDQTNVAKVLNKLKIWKEKTGHSATYGLDKYNSSQNGRFGFTAFDSGIIVA